MMKKIQILINNNEVKKVYHQPVISFIDYEVDGLIALRISDEETGEQLTNSRLNENDPSKNNESEVGSLWYWGDF